MVKNKKPNKKQLSVYNEIQNRINFAAWLGMQYGGKRDLYEALGYPKDILYKDYYAHYRRQDIAKAIINRPINMTWKGLVSISSPTDKADSLKIIWQTLMDTLKLKDRFIRADKLGNIGRYSVLLLGFSDIGNELEFITPVQKTAGLKLVYCTPFDESKAVVKECITDPSNPRYGLPYIYEISLANRNIQVHYSRIIHIPGEVLDDAIYGIPKLEDVFNRLMDLEKLVGGSAEMFWRGAYPGFTGKVEEGYVADKNIKDTLDKQIQEYEHNLRRILINEGVDINSMSQQIADPTGHVDIQITMISAVTGIPKRILLGSERGELASTQDEDAWLSLIDTRRTEYAEIQIIRPVVDTLMDLGVLPYFPDYVVEWSSLFDSSEGEKATLGKTRTEALNTYVSNPVSSELMPPRMFMRHLLGLTDAQIDEIEAWRAEQILGFNETEEDEV